MRLVSNWAHIVGGSDPPKTFYNILYDLMEPKPIVQLLHTACIRSKFDYPISAFYHALPNT